MTGSTRTRALRLAAATAACVALAYQVPRPMILGAADVSSDATFRGFSGAEAGFRWSGARSTILFPDPGPGLPVRVEVSLSGWRPRGQETPLVSVSHGALSRSGRPGHGGETFVLETKTSGVWRSDLAVELRSETFRPGPRDARELGVRVDQARLIPMSGGLRRPPLGAVVVAVAIVLLAFALLRRVDVPPAAAEWTGFALALAIGAAYTFARAAAALGAVPVLVAVAALTAAAWLLPSAARRVASLVARAASALATGARRLADGRAVALAMAGIVAIAFAYRSQPRIEIDLGSGRETAVERGFGVFDAVDGVRYRRAPRGATLDLADFGGGTRWTIEAAASIEGVPRKVALLRAGAAEAVAALQDGPWTSHRIEADAPMGWRAGLAVTVPGGSDAVRIDRVTIDRGAALPSPRTVAAVLSSAALVLVIFGAVGLPPLAGLVAAALVVGGAATALAADPLVVIPFAPTFALIVSIATVLAAVAVAVRDWLAERGVRALPSAVALGAAACGFVAWLAATAFPLYRGGHFVFHSSIAEEIWKGRFLIYYLPYPGSMLSEQAHWGNIVVPHPCLYQTLVSPLAALPRAWFYFAEKAFLAFMFATLVLIASRLAARTAGAVPAAFAAVIVACLVPTFQLLGLGHLMTILGVWASSLALAWLAWRTDRLGETGSWWTAVLLLTFCFLSYFAALLFTAVVLLLLLAYLFKRDPVRLRTFATAVAAASVLAFLLYYVNWAWPFLSKSVPRILGGSGTEPTPVLQRLALEPGKMTYSYGSLLIPLLGLAGLLTLPKSWERVVLLAWGAILILISGGDIFFNFILKHHYYVIVPVAVGLGALFARAWHHSRAGRIGALGVLALMVVLGLQTAIDVAVGRIP